MATDVINVRFFCTQLLTTGEYMMYPTGDINNGKSLYEWVMQFPRDVNRIALHKKYHGCAIEWCGDVSLAYTDYQYVCYTIETRDLVPIVAALMSYHHEGTRINHVWIGKQITPQVIKGAKDFYYDGCPLQADGTRKPPVVMRTNGGAMTFEEIRGAEFGSRWIVAHVMKMIIPTGSNTLTIDHQRMTAFVANDPGWVKVTEINQDDVGWWMDDVIAVHSPLFNAYLAPPPIGISFVDIEESADPPSFEDSVRAKPAAKKTSRQEQRVDLLNARVRELEATVDKYRDYVGYLNDNLNPRLPERLRVKSVADIERD